MAGLHRPLVGPGPARIPPGALLIGPRPLHPALLPIPGPPVSFRLSAPAPLLLLSPRLLCPHTTARRRRLVATSTALLCGEALLLLLLLARYKRRRRGPQGWCSTRRCFGGRLLLRASAALVRAQAPQQLRHVGAHRLGPAAQLQLLSQELDQPINVGVLARVGAGTAWRHGTCCSACAGRCVCVQRAHVHTWRPHLTRKSSTTASGAGAPGCSAAWRSSSAACGPAPAPSMHCYTRMHRLEEVSACCWRRRCLLRAAAAAARARRAGWRWGPPPTTSPTTPSRLA